MKKIVLVKNENYFWEKVESYLHNINADVMTFDGKLSRARIEQLKPDLLVLGAEQAEYMQEPLKYPPVLFIVDGDELAAGSKAEKRSNMSLLIWPVSKQLLLEKTAAVLDVSPRRDFSALIRIMSEDNSFGVLGKSVDFSLSGMSFLSGSFFSGGQHITVTLSLPKSSESIALAGRVTRARGAEDEDSYLYGMEFSRLDERKKGMLQKFILE